MCDFAYIFLQVRIFLLDVCDTLQFVLIELSETCQLKLQHMLDRVLASMPKDTCAKYLCQSIYDMHASLDTIYVNRID